MVDRKRKRRAGNICKEMSDTEFEHDWSVGLGAMLGDKQKSKNYFSSCKDFSGKSRLCHAVEMSNVPIKFDENWWSHC